MYYLQNHLGSQKIFCMDLNNFRLDFVKKFGVNSIRSDNPDLKKKITDDTSIGVDVAIVATSSLDAFQDAIKLVRKGGTVVMFGVPR